MQKIKKILIGTNNKGKFKEIADLLPKDIEKVSPERFNLDVPIENGKTFLENSEIKADFFCKKTNLVTLSDDSGLEIESLNGAPGIFSARWAKEFGSFDNAMNEIIKKVNKANNGTDARFICSLTMQWPNGKKISELGTINGKISQKKGKNGFGYDPIFVPVGYSRTFAEMNYKEKLLIDHRYIAYKKLEKKVKIYF
tara:strand:+ start:173 stop:763 length:591 start_codon:yes stop_codon:yes gene_type:complete